MRARETKREAKEKRIPHVIFRSWLFKGRVLCNRGFSRASGRRDETRTLLLEIDLLVLKRLALSGRQLKNRLAQTSQLSSQDQSRFGIKRTSSFAVKRRG